ncbi:TadE/TadG family type IV pilus assembly protein [Aurantiacibacter gilvus]|uniref:TadE/TadG family type IV pilus assembly protein n=1 Tax=Aurantiacibacter gilvus TaxID=3139141 RepID=A0ABU9IF14_9SPHN
MSVRRFIQDRKGASGAEFALLLPIVLLFLFGIIDAGRYAWEFNKAEKATQVGARHAVVTNLVASDLAAYSFAVQGGIPQGTVVPITAFGGISCSDSGGGASCACTDSTACAFGTTADDAAFGSLVERMRRIMPAVSRENVVITYSWSGLGYSGDPNGPDVHPLVNVQLQDMDYSPLTLFLFDVDVPLPSASYTLTLEDGTGTESDG